jgi:ElaB/YqjD/DUF883 family membrane-anchored ribosome-binding protein
MAASNGVTKEQFKSSFDDLEPLILEEWPDIERDALDDTGGEYDKVVELVAKRTERTKTFVKRQLDELSQIARDRPASVEGRLQRLLTRLESKTQEISTEVSSYVKQTMLPTAEAKVRDHLLLSMIVTACLGFLFGFLSRGSGRDR